MSTAVAERHGNPAGNPQNLRRGGSEKVYDDAAIVKRKLETNLTPTQLAEEFGCSDATVYRALRPAGLMPKPVEFTDEQLRLIHNLLEDECPYTEIAATVGVRRSLIEHRYPGYGIKGGHSETLVYARARRDFERLVQRLGLDEREER